MPWWRGQVKMFLKLEMLRKPGEGNVGGFMVTISWDY